MAPNVLASCVVCGHTHSIGENHGYVCPSCDGRLLPMPRKSITCLALVKPGSDLARTWKLEKPGYGIYEYNKASDSCVIRWGDGSSLELSPEQHRDLVLLPEYCEP